MIIVAARKINRRIAATNRHAAPASKGAEKLLTAWLQRNFAHVPFLKAEA